MEKEIKMNMDNKKNIPKDELKFEPCKSCTQVIAWIDMYGVMVCRCDTIYCIANNDSQLQNIWIDI